MTSEHSERYHRHQNPPVRQPAPGWVRRPQYSHDFQDPQMVASWPDNVVDVDPDDIDPPEYVYGYSPSTAAQQTQPVPAYRQGAANYDYPQPQATSFPSAFTATIAHRPHPESAPAFSAYHSAPTTAVPSVQHGAYTPSSSETSPTSPTSPTAPLTLSPGDDLIAVGAWDNGAALNYADVPKDVRGRGESKRLNLTNLPGKSKRSESTEVHRPSSPKNGKDKKKRGNKNSKSTKGGHGDDRRRRSKHE